MKPLPERLRKLAKDMTEGDPATAGMLLVAAQKIERYEKYLREIAKPALGGKLKQYAAQEALADDGGSKEEST